MFTPPYEYATSENVHMRNPENLKDLNNLLVLENQQKCNFILFHY